ncbi:hypothetical protein FN846DRAFT_954340 [Sphaerosporella brunnea]|uniref:Protein prenylyltransferase n=1 Tax=Sphaerosporella brunnea TaxID=1250544 RepID=A0A5J5EU44_9PEZI|nr:hypothetical protein FN846DRAFT_954340 [Sphaerosporella brunnea]
MSSPSPPAALPPASPTPLPPITAPPPPLEYTTLLAFFHTHRHTPSQISLLPAPYTEILSSPPHLGIPKQCLITAFVHARRIFQLYPSPSPRELLDATTILLLAASEHLTALNTRKRYFHTHLAAGEELVWLESLLTSPLPRHNKSPLLWAHRRWVLSCVSAASTAATSTTTTELDIVRKSAEVHPRNYYAWNHARWVVERFAGAAQEEEDQEVERQLSFCWRHAEDVGVWAFLGWLLERCERVQTVEKVVVEAVEYAREVAPGHESVWCTLRTLVGRVSPAARERVLEMLEKCGSVEGMGEERAREIVLEERAVTWIRRFGQREKPPVISPPDRGHGNGAST